MAIGESADVAPGLSEGVVPGSQPAEGDTGADQLTQLVGGIGEGLGLIRTLVESTPGALPEVTMMLEQITTGFQEAMNMMVQGSDEQAAEPEAPVAPQAALAEQAPVVQKGPGVR